MAKKIVLIGAGSAMFTHGLVADLIRSPDLGPWELGLVDIDPQALETAEGLSQKMVEVAETEITVSASTDRRDILPGADVVVSTIGVGGRRAWELDVTIPRKYGIYQPVGDSVMAGGVSRSMRMIPALVDVARDVQELCPDACFFNYSNPMTTNCWAMRKATGLPVTGLCHGTFHVERQLADFIGAPPAGGHLPVRGLEPHDLHLRPALARPRCLAAGARTGWRKSEESPRTGTSLGQEFPGDGLRPSASRRPTIPSRGPSSRPTAPTLP